MNRRSSDLMKKMGSRNGAFDPEPPDQWRFVLRHGSGCEQALAWIKSKTIAVGHDSPFAIDEDSRRPLKLADMATALGWNVQTARNVIGKLEVQSRARMDEHGRLWLCANVPTAYVARDESDAAETDQQDPWEHFLKSYFSGYLVDSIRGLSTDLRPKFMSRYSAFVEAKTKIMLEAMGAARAITDRYEDTILRDFGVKRTRLKAKSQHLVKIQVLDEVNFLKSLNGDQNGDFLKSEETTFKTAQTDCLKSGHPYIPDPDPDSIVKEPAAAGLSVGSKAPKQTPPPPPSPPQELVKTVSIREVRLAIQRHDPSVTAKQAQKLAADCCKMRPGIETAHVVGVIDYKARQPRGTKPKSLYAAVLATEVPEFVGDDAQFYAWLQNPNGNGAVAADDPEAARRAKTMQMFQERMAKKAANAT